MQLQCHVQLQLQAAVAKLQLAAIQLADIAAKVGLLDTTAISAVLQLQAAVAKLQLQAVAATKLHP